MKNLLTSAAVAAIVSVAVLAFAGRSGNGADASPAGPAAVVADSTAPALTYTEALIEDTWVNAGRTAGSDRRSLTSAATSVCYLTKIEISGIQGPEDSNACAIEVDDFTGFWQLIATVDEGGTSEVRCNARCLAWDSD